jgi:hypothetical protein
MRRKIFLLMSISVLSVGLLTTSGCDDNDGPVEDMGEAIDEAADDAGDAIEDAADEVEDAVDDATDGNN